MKKIYILAVLIYTTAILSSQKVEFTFNFDNYKILDKKNGQIVQIPGTVQFAKPGDPAIPMASVRILLPQSTLATKIEFVYQNKQKIASNIDLLPMQNFRPYCKTDKLIFIKNEDAYKLSVYPQDRDHGFTNQMMNGFSFVISRFSPVEYNAQTKELFLYKQVKAVVDYKENGDYNRLMLSNDPLIIEQVAKFAQNPQMISQYDLNTNRNDVYDVLIITDASYVNLMQPLVDYYTNLGLFSKVVSLTKIGSTMQGIDMPDKMRNYIIQEYQNSAIKYVTLAGDADLVPYRGLYCSVQSSQVYTDNNIPADIYFSALDGNWNTDNDNLWGELGEEDLLPDVSVGRLTFSNQTELNNIVNKLNSYTFNPVTANNELRRPLLAGEHLWDTPLTNGSDYLELLIGLRTDNGYTTNGIPPDHNIVKMYNEIQNWGKTDIINALNSGHSFVHHVGHANETYMMFLSNSDITNQNFSQLDGTTHNFTLVYSHGCICGSFDANDCISERMVAIEKFAVGVFTNSRYGWFNEGQTEGPSAHLHREFVDALYTDSLNSAGDAEKMSKIMTSPWVYQQNEHEPGAQRWCFYDHNCLADPVLPIWVDNPIDDYTVCYNSRFTITGNNYVFLFRNGNAVKNARCAVIQNGQIIARSYTNEQGEAMFEFNNNAISGSASLVIFAYNSLPIIYNIVVYDPLALDTNDKQFLIFPNPAKDYINVYFTKFVATKIEITDVSGKVVLQKIVENKYYELVDISMLLKGLYFLHIKSDDEQKIFKIVKQ